MGDSNPTKTSMDLKNLAQGNFSNWPNASPSRQASSDTWRPHQTERGTVGEPVKGRLSTWRASSPCCATPQPQRSRPARSALWGGWPPARFSTASPLLPAPALAALLSQHHSHFLASPVGYLYERGDR